MSASIQVSERVRIALDPIKGTHTVKRGVLLSLEGRHIGDVQNCVVIPLDKMREVVAALQMAAHEAAQS